jgi:hypothetical protein
MTAVDSVWASDMANTLQEGGMIDMMVMLHQYFQPERSLDLSHSYNTEFAENALPMALIAEPYA